MEINWFYIIFAHFRHNGDRCKIIPNKFERLEKFNEENYRC